MDAAIRDAEGSHLVTVLTVALIGGLFGAVALGAVAGASLTGLVTHPARYGWNWQILIQAEGGYLGAVTLRELGKKVGDTVLAGRAPYRRLLTISGTVTLPSFRAAISQHVSLGQGAMLTEQALLAAQGLSSDAPKTAAATSQAAPSAVAIDLVPGTSPAQRAALVHRIISEPGRDAWRDLPAHAAPRAGRVHRQRHPVGGQPLALAGAGQRPRWPRWR